MAKGQQRQARQPVARTKRSQPAAPRQPSRAGKGSFIKSVTPPAHETPPGTPRKPADRPPKAASGQGAGELSPRMPKQTGAGTSHTTPRKPFVRTESSGQNEFEQRPPTRRKQSASLVSKATKLALRGQAQDVKMKQQQLRARRADLDDIEPIRLQKALAASGIGSRREAEELIEAGLVQINGKKAELGNRVGPRDRVTVKGKAVHLVWQDRLPRIIIYHKQEGEIVSRDDPGKRVSVFDRLPQAKSSRWVTIGRLDVNTSGLLILTTHGGLAHRFAHPSFEVEREYAVRLLGQLTDEQRRALLVGVLLEDGMAKLDMLEEESGSEGANHWYRVGIREGRNREVRRIFESMGLTVSRLIRVRFGPIGLPTRLKRGQFYELNEIEVANIMKWSGLDLPGDRKRKRHE